MLRFPAATVLVAAALPAVATGVSLTVPEAVSRALAANRSLAASRLTREAEEHGLDVARSAFELKLVPVSSVGRLATSALATDAGAINATFGVQARQKLEWGTVLSAGPSYNRAGQASNTGLNVTVQQPLLAGFGPDVNLEPVRQARFSVASAARAVEQAMTNVALETISTYHEALRQRRIAELALSLDQRLHRHALVSASKERAALAGPMDTFRAEIRRRDAQDAANQARTAYEAALDRLRVLLALPSEVEIILAQAPAVAIETETATEDAALANRVELRQMQAELEEAGRAVVVARKATLPDVSLSVAYGHVASADALAGALLPATQRQWSVFLSVSGDIARTAEHGTHRRAAARLEALRAGLAEKADDIRRQVRQQWRLIGELRARMALREEQIRQAEGKVALANVKFAHDMADNFDLVEAETELQRAQVEYETAKSDFAVAAHSLRASTGRTLP